MLLTKKNRQLISFSLIIAAVIVFISLKILGSTTMKFENGLKVAFPYNKFAKSYDPAHIYFAPEYIFLENVFSPLLEMDSTGTLQAGVANRFEWIGNEAHLTLRDDIRTVDGYKITAKDAAVSIRRLLVMAGNTHGDIQRLLCGKNKLKHINDDCPGIAVNGNTLILKPGKKMLFLLPMLTAIDFAVIPIPSIDKKSLHITDYRNTSGPYYVESEEEGGRIALKANTNHYNYREKMPQRIELIPVDNANLMDSINKFKAGSVDLLTTIDHSAAKDVINYQKSDSDSVLHRTVKIRTLLLQFTDKGRKRLSEQERFSLGKKIKNIFIERYGKEEGYEVTNQFFPVFGEGGLAPDQLLAIDQKIANSASSSIGKGFKLRLTIVSDKHGIKEAMLKHLPGITIDEGALPNFSGKLSEKDMPDFVVVGTDTGFLEDVGLLTYSISSGNFGLNKERASKWLDEYMNTPEKADRINKVRDLHFQALSEPVIIPLMRCPYVAMVRKPWRLDLPQYYANNPFWSIQWNN